MQPIVINTAALAVAVIFYTWRTWKEIGVRKEKTLRSRVAYMLWVAASQCNIGSEQMRRVTV